MNAPDLRPETEATLLLCGGLANTRDDEAITPLNVREFNDFLRLLDRLSISLDNLLSEESQQRLRNDIEGRALLDDRIGGLLDRGPHLAQAAERWASQGIWVLDRTHPDYPERYRHRIGDSAPPLLYGAGDTSLLNSEGPRLAVVGSRDIDREAEHFARESGAQAAGAGVTIVSGGAKGVDRTAMSGALDHGGTGIAVLPGDLERVATSRAFRGFIAEGRLVVASPYHPRAKFTAGNAMGRNRLIYCLASIALVVNSGAGTGGTWSGATETLKNDWVPVYVRQSPTAPEGNRALLEHGAQPVEQALIEHPDSFRQWLGKALEEAAATEQTPENLQLGLF